MIENTKGNMMNIPTYRAKRLDSDEWVYGSCIYPYKGNSYFIVVYDGCEDFEIDPTTLSINFENMIDKNGKKIFASLSDDGVGGDIVNLINWNQGWDTYTEYGVDEERIVLFSEYSVIVKSFYRDAYCNFDMVGLEECEVIGIYKG